MHLIIHLNRNHVSHSGICFLKENFIIRYNLTPGSIIILEKLIVTQQVKKFLTFYRTQKFITTFIGAHHRFLSRAIYIQVHTLSLLGIKPQLSSL